ncbi:MAG: decaprenyl-phosphate phosphoribosyltransferase, partial [Thermoanaerobaculia bacterium]
VASAVYLFNDIRDREEDRHHPRKRDRPIASGRLAVAVAAIAATALAATALAIGLALGGAFVAILVAYLLSNMAYSMGLKRVVIVDVMVLSVGFVLRVMSGGVAVGVEVSAWLILCTSFLALFLAFSKRRHELMLLADDASEQRQVLTHYSPAFLDQMINVVTAGTVVAYAVYAISPETVEKFHTRDLIFTMPFVLFGIFRYLYLIYQRPSERNPTDAILGDKPFLINILLWVASVVWVIYRQLVLDLLRGGGSG